MRTAGKIFINQYVEENFKISSDLFTSVEGRKFENWIERSMTVSSVDTTDNEIVFATEHDFSNNDQVDFYTAGTYPTGISAATRYFVIYVDSLTIKLSLTFSGSAVDITGAGSGTFYVRRFSGYETLDLINNAPYIIESVLRDEVFKEHNLLIDEVVTKYDELIVSGLKKNIDDWYNGSIILDRNISMKVNVLDYNGSSNMLTTDSTVFEPHVANDVIEIYNIRGSKKIDCSTFDYIGNTADGKRDGWTFGASIHKNISVSQLINTLLFESHCIMTLSSGKYKLFALDDDNVVATWTNPLKINGREGILSQLTPIENVYNNFVIKWKHDIGSNDYQRKLIVNRNVPSGYLTANNGVGDYERNLCRWSYKNYNFEKTYEYGCAFIYDDATAEKFIVRLIRWLYKRRLIVTWNADFGNYIKYEIGDVVKLDYNRYIPASMRASSSFMIIGKSIHARNVPYITFSLIEID